MDEANVMLLCLLVVVWRSSLLSMVKLFSSFSPFFSSNHLVTTYPHDGVDNLFGTGFKIPVRLAGGVEKIGPEIHHNGLFV